MSKILFILLFILSVHSFAQTKIYGQVFDKESQKVLPFARVQLITESDSTKLFADEFGRFNFEINGIDQVKLVVLSTGYFDFVDTIDLVSDEINLKIDMSFNDLLPTVVITFVDINQTRNMSVIDGATLTHSKKTQVLNLDKIPANTATNNAREIYATVPGLQIWESDGGGLQLGIGARGLSPNRTEHFNTRQNGYDISADALGYPETYYTPPTDAIESIQIIRGASSLQFGPQFGGMINFKLRSPSSKPISYLGNHTYGSFNLYNTFNLVSGTLNRRFSYLAYYNYKQGDGWRDNSSFKQQHIFGHLKYYFTENIFLSADYTRMNYLAQQAGGLTDALFENNPKQSIRNRNWFEVNWQIISLNFQWKISRDALMDIKYFKVDANRNALGNLDKISRLDDYKERDLISGEFSNYGIELRMLQHYPIGKKMRGALVYGGRYYQGETTNIQGLADSTSLPHFEFINPNEVTGSNYLFPSKNIAGYFENMIQLNSKFWLSAGFRYEFIHTEAQGTYREQVFHPLTGETLVDTTYSEYKNSSRSIYLGGIGMTYKLNSKGEIYSNIAQNYRGINFSDIRVTNPNIQVDPNMKDEKGFNADLGIRNYAKNWSYDASIFFLYYTDKIGLTDLKLSEFETVRYRTNLGTAYSTGIELFVEHKHFSPKSDSIYWTVFLNSSYVYAKYAKTNEVAIANKWVELVPPVTAKIGFKYQFMKWRFSLLGSYVHKHFTDATNANFDADAIAGIIPSYFVLDFGMSYQWKKFMTIRAGINNATNAKYYTRRATGYPGPGIIPADGINAYITISLNF